MNVDAGHTGGAGRSHRRIPARQPAADRLRELLYPELRRLVASKMKGERLEHTWQPTVLVNELELLRVRALREPLSKLARFSSTSTLTALLAMGRACRASSRFIR